MTTVLRQEELNRASDRHFPRVELSYGRWVAMDGNTCDLFRQIQPFLTISRRVVLAADWNAVLDPDIYRKAERSESNYPDVKRFRVFIDKFNALNKFL